MRKNINRKDGIIRAILGIALVVAFFFKVIDDELLEIMAGVIGFILLISAVLEFCPLYYFLGIKTRQSRRDKFY